MQSQPLNTQRAFLLVASCLAGLTILRVAALFLSPIELYPDEAQYWVWSRHLAWGYFSKPPMIAWLIALSTGIGGQAEAWVRLPSLILQGIAPLFLFDAARRLYDARVALLAAVVYSLTPGVQLSCGVASTDAPLLFFLSGATWAYVALLQAPARRGASIIWGGAVGLLLGLAFLSKYAAAYLLIGLVAHALVSADARRAWRPGALVPAIIGLTLMLAPNFGWNAHNRFATFAHTAANADWHAATFFHPGALAAFALSQIGVFGPVPFAALTVGSVLAARRRRAEGPDALLLCLTLPAILIVALQALLSRANANWAFAAYGSGSILAAAWMARWRWRRAAGLGLVLQAVLAAVFLLAAADPAIADRLGLANSLKRARGWETMSREVAALARRETGLTAIAVDERFVFNEFSYYGRDALAEAGAPPLRMWVRESRPMSHAELAAPLDRSNGGRVLAVARVPEYRQAFIDDFAAIQRRPGLDIRLDKTRVRRLTIFLGEGFSRRPRDPLTGDPIEP